MRVRIESSGPTVDSIVVKDMETGLPIEDIVSIEIRPVHAGDGPIEATLDILLWGGFDIVAEASGAVSRCCTHCRRTHLCRTIE